MLDVKRTKSVVDFEDVLHLEIEDVLCRSQGYEMALKPPSPLLL